jgi:hypothetical protein
MWQPMQTAPKDGTEIMVCYDDAFYSPSIVSWVDWKPGWYNGDYTYDADAFDFWMPLPPPPQKSK